MASRSVVPIASSATPGRRTRPVIVHTIVPGDSAVPTERNHSEPRSTILGTLASVSTLSTSVGGTTLSSAAVAIPTPADRPLSLLTSSWSRTTSSTPRR